VHVIGREEADGPVGHLGSYRARDGSAGARVGVDLERPHVALIVGKRGSGKSYTMGVLAEELAHATGVRPIIGDTMAVFGSLAAASDLAGRTVESTVSAGTLSPPEWCELVGVDPERPAGALVWRVARACDTLEGMLEAVDSVDASRSARRAARNHLRMVQSWNVFRPGEPDWPADGGCARLDLSGRDRAPANAVVAGIAGRTYDRCLADAAGPLPWLMLDEAHVFFDGVAATALRRLLTRGRAPGVSLVVATQRPGALPPVAISQADLLVVHRLSGHTDRQALVDARPALLSDALDDRLPTAVGEALVVDDATETAHTITVRERDTPHDGESPRASERTTVPPRHRNR
jgi:DNA helicase HerA-like ATPase